MNQPRCIIRFCGFFLFVLILSSCDFLEVKPQDTIPYDQYYETEEDLETALNGIYRQLASNDLYGDYMQGRMGLSADLGYCNFANDLNSVSFNQNSVSDAKVLAYWKRLYVCINRANLLLAHIDKPEMDAVRRGYIEGEALFLRAYCYFLLVNKFKNILLVLEVAPESSPEYTQIEQSAPAVVYAQITADMEKAALLVRPAAECKGGGRVSQSAVWGVLARVYLTMAGYPLHLTGKYADAERCARKVIDLNFHRLNPSYEQVFINYAQDKYDIGESIFELEYWGDNTSIYYTAGRVGRNTGIPSTAKSPIGYCGGFLRATEYLYKLYDADDVRRGWCINTYTYVADSEEKVPIADGANLWFRFCAKFRREYETATGKSSIATSINFPVLRYADVLLMYAEAHLNNPQADAADDAFALECFNQVRRRGHGQAVEVPGSADYVPASREEYMSEIRDERARELAYELLRRDDLVRWGLYVEQMKYVGQMVPANFTWKRYTSAYFDNVSARDVCYPIPSYEMGVNKKLVQNQGW